MMYDRGILQNEKRVVPRTRGVLNEWFVGSFPETVSDPNKHLNLQF